MSPDAGEVRMVLGQLPERHPDRRLPIDLGDPASVPDVATLAALLEHRASERSELACAYFIDLDSNVTSLRWGELYEGARRWASGLARFGVVPGDRVVLALPTSAELLLAFFACQWLGATPCI